MKSKPVVIVVVISLCILAGVAVYFRMTGVIGTSAGGGLSVGPSAAGGPPAGGAPNGGARPAGGAGGNGARAGGPGALPAGMSQAERSLLQSLTADQRQDVLARYQAAIAEGKKPRLADFMPETTYSVKAAVAKRATVQTYLDINGDVTTRTNVEVYPDIGGKLTELRVSLGDKVEKNQAIATVDPSKPGAAYAPSSVRSPIAGTVTAVNVSQGSTVSTGTAIVKVGILEDIEIHADIRERDVSSVTAGMWAQARFEAFSGEVFGAAVIHVSPVVDATARTQEIVLTFSNRDPRILPGMYARVRIFTVAHVDRITIPLSAVIERYGKYYVYVVSKKESVDRAELREISRGLTVDEVVEVTGGLEEGERVVTSGQAALGDGALLRIVSSEGGVK